MVYKESLTLNLVTKFGLEMMKKYVLLTK